MILSRLPVNLAMAAAAIATTVKIAMPRPIIGLLLNQPTSCSAFDRGGLPEDV
ncbi:MAG: hypothetical protein AAGD09_02675 [Cyanobacteria bacterium P01_F01_bin.56]